MKRSVYIETTIPSFFYEVRNDPEMIARRESTRRWWADERERYDIFSSIFTIAELEDGEFPGKADALALLQPIPLLQFDPHINDIAQVYIKRHLMPKNDSGDAYHLAAASFYGMNFLLTWNGRHLANANKTQHIESVNAALGLATPVITTPDLLIWEDEA